MARRRRSLAALGPMATACRRVACPTWPLEVVAQSPAWVVINKPPGLLSAPGKIEPDSASTRLTHHFPGLSGSVNVHRLDMDTSGLLLMALSPLAHRALSIAFQERRIQKRYTAILEGEIAAEAGVIRLAFRLDPDRRPYQVLDPEQGRLGETRFERVAVAGGRSRVHFYPKTGRTHQLRLHAAHPLGLNAPILGDRLYGRAGPRLHLHADQLCFEDPLTGQRVEISAPAPF